MAKKARKRSSTARAEAAAPSTRCDLGGDEILPVLIRVEATVVVDFVLLICLAAARVQVFLDTERIAEADGQDEVRLRLPPMSPGVHSLMWSHLTPSPTWKTRAEIAANTVTLFRRRKSSDGSNPTNSGFALLEVI